MLHHFKQQPHISDAKVIKTVLKCNGKEVEGNSALWRGLSPNSSYTVEYIVTVEYGKGETSTATYKGKVLYRLKR